MSPVPPPVSPPVTLNFRDPKALAAWLALDGLIAAINTTTNQLRILGDFPRATQLEQKSNDVGALRDDVLREQTSGIVLAAGSLPPPKG